MANAYRDENDVPTLIASSNVDGQTPVRVYADPVTHRLLVDQSGAIGVTSINGDTTAAQTLTVGTTGTDFAIVDNGTGDHKFNLPDASATARGVVTTGTQTFAGAKTFTGAISASNLSGTNTGDQNLFSNIPVSGQTTVTASTPTTALTFVAGSGMTITTDNTTKTISFAAASSGGSVTTVSVVSANGFAGTVANATTTPAITLTTSVTGILKGNGTAISAATDGSDYLSSTTGVTIAQGVAQTVGTTTNRVLKIWATDLTVTNAIAGSITGNAATVTTNANLTGPITSTGNATAIASQTGTGTKFVVDNTPTLITPVLGVATATSLAIGGATLGTNGLAVTGHLLLEGVTSTGATGTGKLVFDTSPTLVTPLLGTPTSGVMTNVTGTATGLTSGITNALKSATTTVDVSAATAPSAGQVLKATSGTAATWQTLSAGGTTFVTTQVFNGTAPTSMTDLDLSAVVGAAQKMVQIVCTGSNQYFFFQRKGTGYTFSTNTSIQPGGDSVARIQNTGGTSELITVATDTSGFVQWASSAASAVTLNVEAYW